MSEARDFLAWWFDGVPAGCYGLSWQYSGGPFLNGTAASVDELASLAEQHDAAGAASVWFRVTTLARPPQGRGTAAETVGLPGLWADLDIAGAGHRNSGLPVDEAAALQIIERAGIEAGRVVHTGGGLSVWWKFDRPVVVDGVEALRYAAGLSERFATRLISASPGVKVDNVRDLARVMRLPGTTNRKVADAPRACRLLSGAPPYRTFAPDEIVPQPSVRPAAVPTISSILAEHDSDAGAPGLGVSGSGRGGGSDTEHDVPWIHAKITEQLERVRTGFIFPGDGRRPGHDGMHQTIYEAAMMLGHAIPCGALTEERAWELLIGACDTLYGAADANDRTHIARGLAFGQANGAWSVRTEGKKNDEGSGSGGRELPSPMTPAPAARAISGHLVDRGLLLRYWRGDWYRHGGAHWIPISERAVRTAIYHETEHAHYMAFDEKTEEWKQKPWNPYTRTVAFALDALSSAVVGRDDELDEDRCIALSNGVLEFGNGVRTLHAHSPERFNLWSLPYAYDPAAACPVWLDFLSQQVPDAESQRLLQEYFGYLVSGRTDLEKLLHIYGVRRGGKSTAAGVAEALVGKRNSVSVTLAGLTGAFGEQPLIGKSLALVTDANWKIREVTTAVEVIKAIVGRDTRTVNRKNRIEWTGPIAARWIIVGNDEPEFKDASGALLGRMIHIYFGNSVYGREDTTLKDRLLTELPGILNWALDGLDLLNSTGSLHVPRASMESERQIARGTSPVAGFIEDRITLMDPTCGLSSWVDDLWPAYLEWCRTEGKTSVPDKSQFSRVFGTAIGRKAVRQRPGGRDTNPRPIFHGVALLPPGQDLHAQASKINGLGVAGG